MNHHTSSLRFIFAVIIIAVLNKFYGVSLWWLAVPITIRGGKLIAGTLYMSYQFFGKTYTQGSMDNKSIALTFDDGPDKIYTPKILAILAEHKISATFFLIGKKIEGNEELVKQIDSEGHTIGNHTWSHSFFIDFKGKKGFIKELNKASDKVFSVIGKRMKLFRPPYGVTTPGLTRAYIALDYLCIGWTIRSFDTTKKTEQEIMKRIEFGMEEGDVVLFHDSSEKTVNLLKQTITFAKENGFEIVGVEKLFNIYAYE